MLSDVKLLSMKLNKYKCFKLKACQQQDRLWPCARSVHFHWQWLNRRKNNNLKDKEGLLLSAFEVNKGTSHSLKMYSIHRDKVKNQPKRSLRWDVSRRVFLCNAIVENRFSTTQDRTGQPGHGTSPSWWLPPALFFASFSQQCLGKPCQDVKALGVLWLNKILCLSCGWPNNKFLSEPKLTQEVNNSADLILFRNCF